MPRYIVRPRKLIVRNELSLANTSLSPAQRRQQREVLKQLIADHEASRELIRLVKRVKGRVLRRLNHAIESNSILGTVVMELDESAAKELANEVDDFLVMRDRPIGLVEPVSTLGVRVRNPSENNLWHLSAIGLDDLQTTPDKSTGQGVHVAVLDTGANAEHAALSAKLDRGISIDSDTGRLTEGVATETDRISFHGTHVSGLICGDQVGIAPDARVTPVTMIPKKHGTLANFVWALDWVAGQDNIQIVNLSAGLPELETGLREALEDLQAVGIFPIGAVGNDGRDRTRSPANLPGCLSVGACDRESRIPSWSSSGAVNVDGHIHSVPDIVAPGDGVMSTTRTGFFETMQGTSMAAPIVSGIAALVLQQQPNITINDLDDALLRACAALPGEAHLRQGAGIIRVDQGLLETSSSIDAAATVGSGPVT